MLLRRSTPLRALPVELLRQKTAGAVAMVSTHDHAFAQAPGARVIDFDALRADREAHGTFA